MKGSERPSLGLYVDQESKIITHSSVKSRVEEIFHLESTNVDNWPQESYLDQDLGSFVIVDLSKIEFPWGNIYRRHLLLGGVGFVTAELVKSQVFPECAKDPYLTLSNYSLRLRDSADGSWYSFSCFTRADGTESEVEVARNLDLIIQAGGSKINRWSPIFIEKAERAFLNGKPYIEDF